MNCTHCGDPLQRELRRGVEIDRCTSCGSVVLDRFELSSWLGASSTLEDQLAEAARGARATGECSPRAASQDTRFDLDAAERALDAATDAIDLSDLLELFSELLGAAGSLLD